MPKTGADRRRREGGGAELSEGERAELARLRKECAELRMRCDVLKRSLVLWVADSAAGPQPAHWYDRNNSPTTAASGALTLKYTYRTHGRRASSPASAIQTGNSTMSVRGQP